MVVVTGSAYKMIEVRLFLPPVAGRLLNLVPPLQERRHPFQGKQLRRWLSPRYLLMNLKY